MPTGTGRMKKPTDRLPARSSRSEVDAFLRAVASAPAARSHTARGRLLFALDATASREPTWQRACAIQGQMFVETARLGGLDVQLCHYRGLQEFYASPWFDNPTALLDSMRAVRCAGGLTQIGQVLHHALAETRRRKVSALVFVGDCMEEELDRLCGLAGELGLLGVPGFFFHEGRDAVAERAFRELARLTRGAYCAFDASSADQLRDLLSAVAVYAAGGRPALEEFGRRCGGAVLRLTQQLEQG